MRRLPGCSAFAVAVLALSAMLTGSAEAATFSIVNLDSPGEGFNDTTPASPVGGNEGTTVGEQRLIAFQYAADLWGARIASPVTIVVEAQFDPLFCTSTSAVLGQAGPDGFFANFPGAPLTNTWYVSSQADAIRGIDSNPGQSDIFAQFNSQLGTPGCFEGPGFYLGLDGNDGAGIDFVTVLAHELGHGLGFLSSVNVNNGQYLSGRPDAYIQFLEDHSTGKLWPSMTDGERLTSITDGSQVSSDLHWTGTEVIDQAQAALTVGKALTGGVGENGHIEMYAPNPVEGGSSVSHYAKTVSPDELMEPAFTQSNHNLDMSLALFKDIGYPLIYPCGDATQDEVVSASDALFALNAAVGALTCLESLCDVTGDGRTTATDALALLGFAVGTTTAIFCGLS